MRTLFVSVLALCILFEPSLSRADPLANCSAKKPITRELFCEAETLLLRLRSVEGEYRKALLGAREDRAVALMEFEQFLEQALPEDLEALRKDMRESLAIAREKSARADELLVEMKILQKRHSNAKTRFLEKLRSSL
jgi:hypothetical protein